MEKLCIASENHSYVYTISSWRLVLIFQIHRLKQINGAGHQFGFSWMSCQWLWLFIFRRLFSFCFGWWCIFYEVIIKKQFEILLLRIVTNLNSKYYSSIHNLLKVKNKIRMVRLNIWIYLFTYRDVSFWVEKKKIEELFILAQNLEFLKMLILFI